MATLESNSTAFVEEADNTSNKDYEISTPDVSDNDAESLETVSLSSCSSIKQNNFNELEETPVPLKCSQTSVVNTIVPLYENKAPERNLLINTIICPRRPGCHIL